MGIVGFLLLMAYGIRKAKIQPLILGLGFLFLFIPNSFLFAKWTRFITPALPFFPIFSTFLLSEIKKKEKQFSYFLIGILLITTGLWTLAFFSIYTRHDIRIDASNWIEQHAKSGSTFLVEGGNTVDLPLTGNFNRLSLDFYNLEEDGATRQKIINGLFDSDYFLVQSRRVFMNHQRLPSLYPKTARFYDALFNGQLGFTQIKEVHSYPQLGSLEFPDEGAEETWSVFDHPVIRVFKKTRQLTKEEYARFL